MTKSKGSKIGARVRASELYMAAADKRGAYKEISRLLALEGYGEVSVNTLRTWAARDGWREPRMNQKAIKKYHAEIVDNLVARDPPTYRADPRLASMESVFFEIAHATRMLAVKVLTDGPHVKTEGRATLPCSLRHSPPPQKP